ncbi:hypothetical protein BN2475_540058 [Paraburkholderia ribeironis]|uniref:Uncharacterized protein n=1 Tax=Paraburkholderia ribeironis TaxID=1247936 RepID=A0A1N7SDC7_9BURK|nr:hypothetical protein [Paraburkholderia ribeironis]SIT45334.1 hypothetical protein BN2475_540058 [Paraburkholderia ribeironis]
MSETTKDIQVIIPSEIQERIKTEELKLTGTQVRDSQGRIVRNLKSIDLSPGQYFSPNLTVRFEGYTFISESVISRQLQRELDVNRREFLSVASKIDRVLQGQTNDLVASIAIFDAHFQKLLSRSSLIDKNQAYASGVESAALLAAHLGSYIDDYINSTTVFHRDVGLKGEIYQNFLNRGQYKPYITHSRFEPFDIHQAKFFAYSFLQILNNINILSLCFDRRIFERYYENLEGLKHTLLKLFRVLVHGISGEGDIYQMCYAPEVGGQSRRPPKDILRIIKHDGSATIDEVIARNYGATNPPLLDENRISSIDTVMDLLEEIENLKLRADQYENVDLSELSDLSEIQNLLFTDSK